MKLFGVTITEMPRNELKETLVHRIDQGKKTFVVTANALIMLKVAEDPTYKEAVLKADYIIPDGFGVQLVHKLKKRNGFQRYPGRELATDLLKEGKKRNWSFYLLGARPEVVEKLAEMLKEKGINIAGYHHGYFKGDGPVNEILKLSPDVVFVAMGAPKQELWIAKNIDRFEKGLFIGLGGTFDVLSGFKKRAPKWMIKMGLEWLYRFFQSPSERWNVPLRIARFLLKALIYTRREV